MRSLNITQKRYKTRLTPGFTLTSSSPNINFENSERYESFPQLQNFIKADENNIRRASLLEALLRNTYGVRNNFYYQKYSYLTIFLLIISCYIIHIWQLNNLIQTKQNNLPWLFEDLSYYKLNTSKSSLSNSRDIQKTDLLLKDIFQKLTLLINYSKTLQNKINEAELKNKDLEKIINELRSTAYIQTERCMNSDRMELKAIMEDILMEYDIDKLGLTDYALESSGGSIISTEAKPSSVGAPVLTFLGFQLWTLQPSPRVILQSNVEPGNCFAFEGYSAKFNIQLVTTIFISAFTMEHIPSNIAIDISTAPKDFSVLALTENSLISLGIYTYKIPGSSQQTFEVNTEGAKYPHGKIQLQIHSNYGNKFYTCLYRFRVHGEPLGKL